MSTTRQLPGFAVTGTGTRQGQLAGFSWSDETSSGTAVSVNVTDVSTTSALGTVSVLGKSLTTLSNVVATGYISSVTINGKALTNLTGVQATGVVTDVVIAGKSLVNLSGVAISGYISSVSVISGTAAQVTGVLVTGSVSTPTVLGKAKANLSAVLTTSALGTVTIYEPPVPQSINGDPDFNYVSLLLPFNGSNGATTFYDASPIPKTVTRNGNTVISDTQSKFGGTSGYFDGSGDYLTVPADVSLNITSGNFTIECWEYLSSIPSAPYMLVTQDDGASDGQTFQFRIDGGTSYLRFIYWTGFSRSQNVQLASSTAVSLNTWTHLAVSWDGTKLRLFQNGVLTAESNVSAMYSSTITTGIGSYNGNSFSNFFNGYIDSLRITKGAARYTSSFTVPTSPFPTDWLDESDTYYDNVVLHLPMDGPENGTTFVDRSKTPKSVTTVGNTTLKATQSKFGGRSCYFDGSGDYLTVPASTDFDFPSDFTIEFYVYLSAYSAPFNGAYGAAIAARYNGFAGADKGWQVRINGTASSYDTLNIYTGVTDLYLSASFNLNTWYHVAIARSGSSLRAFVNGVQVGATITNSDLFTQSTQNPLYIGRLNDSGYIFYLNGYIDSLRITKGTARYTSNFTVPTGPFAIGKPYTVDPYASNVKLLLTGSGAHGSQVIEDKSSVGNTITVVGNTLVDRVRSKVYGGSIYFDGSGDYLELSDTSELQLGTGDFTIEAWVYCTANTLYNVFASKGASTDGFFFGTFAGTNQIRVDLNGTTLYTFSSTITLNAWTHVALVRTGTSINVYVNGVKDPYTLVGSENISAATNPLRIGRGRGGSANYLTGYINNLRITKGVARYTANFTPDYSYLIPLSVQPTLVYVEGVGIVAYIGTLNLSAIVYPIGILTDAELGIGRVAAWGNLGTSQIPNWALVNDANISLWRLVDDSQTTDWQTIH